MSLFTNDDLLILESVLRKEDFITCQKVFKEITFLGFLDAKNLDLTYERTQSKLRHLITVVKPWSCTTDKIKSFASSTGIDLSDPTPFVSVWTGLCTTGCPLCYSMKNYSLKHEYYLGKSWKHRSKYQRFHSNLVTIVTNFLQDNIVLMVDKYCQDKSPVSSKSSCVHYDPLVKDELDTITEESAACDFSLKSETDPFKFGSDMLLDSSLRTKPLRRRRPVFGLAADCFHLPELDRVMNDETSNIPVPTHQQNERTLGAEEFDYHSDQFVEDCIIGTYTQMG
jgi:hypothetical protein